MKMFAINPMKLCATKRSVTRRLAAAALVFGGLFAGNLAQARADVRIEASPGGDVVAYLQFFATLERSGERVVLDGPCYSACTLVLSTIPRDRICVTSRAVLGFHAAQLLDLSDRRRYPASAATRLLASTYPPAVQSWIDRHGGLSSKLILLRGKELAALYPRCT
jgi:hypothetical protein